MSSLNLNCTPTALLALAACFRCLTNRQKRVYITYLLCQYAKNGVK